MGVRAPGVGGARKGVAESLVKERRLSIAWTLLGRERRERGDGGLRRRKALVQLRG
mgnify:CR=1 FL=1